MSEVLALDGISVHFGAVRAVDEVSLGLTAGKVYGVVGPNGSGKSTLLGAVSRLTPSTAGTIRFRGSDCTRWTPQRLARHGLARTFQTVRLLPTLSVLDNIRLGADVRVVGTGVWKPWVLPVWSARRERTIREIAERAMERLGITALRDRLPHQLSYGNQRRVEIARAIAADPAMLLLDEPTAGMTGDERDGIVQVVASLRAEGLTQVVVDHDVDMIVNLADHLFVLSEGRVIAQGHPPDVVGDPRVQEAYLGRRHRADTGDR
ncbi:MAG TPA: ABC transporter ATP-binding protein [Amycolatopsis sp.]|nr:ABC transporter ATP-binding protein [Amycolatopsis sp.]